MKKLCIFLSILALAATTLISCRNYDTRDGRYDYYNDPAYFETRNNRSVGERIDNGINRTENGIRRGFDRAETGFENVTGMDTDRR